jgi:hypothetical protein
MDSETENLLRLLARIDTDGQSAEHVANLAVMYAEKARRILAKRLANKQATDAVSLGASISRIARR